jgi:photosystem II stability/assembly factor-like uncharacterized protein
MENRRSTFVALLGALLVAVLVPVGGAQSRQQEDRPAWSQIALDRVSVWHLVADPVHAGRLYALAPNPGRPAVLDFYRSDDRGETWNIPGARPEPGSIFIAGIGIDPTGAIYLPDSLSATYRSDDGGETWVPISERLMGASGGYGGSGLVVAPSEPQVIYVAGGANRVYRSEDGGYSWRSRRPSVPCDVQSVAVDPYVAGTVYAGGGCGLLRSDDGGTTWAQLMDHYAVEVLVNPADPTIIYAGTGHDGIWRSLDAGESWTQLSSQSAVRQLLFDRRDPAYDALIVRHGDSVSWSGDGGTTWRALGSPPVAATPPNPFLQQLAALDGHVLAGTQGSGIWRVALPPLPWLRVVSPTQVFSVTDDPLWIAQPGESYRVRREEAGWALAVREDSGPEWSVWIPLDARVQQVMT